MNLKEHNQLQIKEALGEVNRYYFWVVNKRDPKNDTELILFYIENGGAKDFRERQRDH